MSTSSRSATSPAGRRPLVPDRMRLVAEWTTPQRDHFELWADRASGDGRLVAVGSYGTEVAAEITLGRPPEVAWRGTLAARSPYWKVSETANVRHHLAGGAA